MTTRHHSMAPADATPPTALWWLDDSDDNSAAAGVVTAAAGGSDRIRDGGSEKTATLGDSVNDGLGDDEGANDSAAGDPTAMAGDGVSPATTTAARETLPQFLSRLSQRLVLTYTSAGDVVLDLHGDTRLREAASHTGRTYLHLADRPAIADLDRRATPTSLIVIRSPSDVANTQLTSIDDLLLACRLMMTAQVATLALIDITQHGHQARQAHVDRLRAAATRAGLCSAGRIIAMRSHGGGDRFLFYADDHARGVAADPHGPVAEIDLFVASGSGGPS
jgi:hypothetical protein